MTDPIHPPHVAEWLITLFTPVHEAKALLGDLQERCHENGLKLDV